MSSEDLDLAAGEMADEMSTLTAGRGRRIAASFTSRLLFIGFNSLASLVAVTLALRSLGAVGFGTLSVLLSLQTLVVFADLGVGVSVTNAVAHAGTAQERRTAVAVAAKAAQLLVLVALVLLVLTAVVALTVGWADLLATGTDASGVDAAVIVSLGCFALTLPLTVGERVLLGLQRQYLANLLLMSRGILVLALTWWAAALHPTSLVAFASAQALPGLAAYVLVGAGALLTLRRLDWPLRQVSSHSRYRDLVASSVPAFLGTVAHAALFNSQRLIVNSATGALDVTRYALGLQVFTPSYGVVWSFGATMWPAMENARSVNDVAWARRTWWRLTLLAVVATPVILVAFPWAGEWVAELVSDDPALIDPAVFLGFAALLSVQLLVQPSVALLMRPAGLWTQVASLFATVAVGVPLAIAWAGSWGPAGAVWALTVGFAAIYTPVMIVAAALTLRSDRRGADASALSTVG